MRQTVTFTGFKTERSLQQTGFSRAGGMGQVWDDLGYYGRAEVRKERKSRQTKAQASNKDLFALSPASSTY